jgi:hypothetical protein
MPTIFSIFKLLSGFEGSYTRHRLLILLLKRGTKVPEKKQVKVFEKILQPNPKSLYWVIFQFLFFFFLIK